MSILLFLFGLVRSLRNFYIKRGSSNSNIGSTDVGEDRGKKNKNKKLSQASKNITSNLENKTYANESV